MFVNLKSISGIENEDWVVIAPSLISENELIVCTMSQWKEEIKGYIKTLNLLSAEQKAIEEKMIKSAMFRRINDDLTIRMRLNTEIPFSKDRIEDILSMVDFEEHICEYTVLKKRGKNFIGLCPFHRETNPSFTYSPSKKVFKCFGCGRGGDVVSFIMEIKNISYLDTLRFLEKKNYENMGVWDKPIDDLDLPF